MENIINNNISKYYSIPNTPSSYHPINLLAFFAKLSEKIILKHTSEIINDKQIIHSTTQFNFQNKHSSIHQIHHLTDSIAP